MDVYVVPIGRGRYALYCEPGDDPHLATPPPAAGRWKRWVEKFSAVVAAVEREQEEHGHPHASASGRPVASWAGRVRRRVLGWMAEKIAEQRLLWRLRGQAEVRAHHPLSMNEGAALSTIRGTLLREFDRHRWWMVIDLLGGLLALALTPIPGPNLLGYYFTFRIVGHFLSLRGARHGLRGVRWDLVPNAPLAELDGIERLARADRESRVKLVAERLGLHRFPRFFERTAAGAA